MTHLLETKFHIPPWRTRGISRPHLVARLQAGMDEEHRLTLVSAPAGYGKTTLLAEWLASKAGESQNGATAHRATDIAWLSLDDNDNDPIRFLAYWIAALQRVEPSIGQRTQSLLAVPQLPSIAVLMDELLNDLATLDRQIMLVLDDLHVIHNLQLVDALDYFVTHQPRQVHLAITTRVDPPLPLSRMRARGQLTEIRAHDLRFTVTETREFFRHSMKLDLDAGTVATLETRTEGWPAGLQLAALALQTADDQEGFVAEFSGSHRHIIDYLIDEVLSHQPPEVHHFLSATATLQRFNAALCTAVTGNGQAASLLAELDRANLFLVPLDDGAASRTGGWYRYHHLFADVLRAGISPELATQAQHIAGTWFEEHGMVSEAIPYWLAIPDIAQAVRLINQLAADLLKSGELQTLLRWLDALPVNHVDQEPNLAAYKALCLVMTGQITTAGEYADRVFSTPASDAQGNHRGRQLAIRSWLSVTMGKEQSGQLAEAALEQLAPEDTFFRALAMISLGTAYSWEHNLPASSRVFREAQALGRAMAHPFLSLGALANLAFNLREMGQLREAESLCRAALSEYVDRRGRPLQILGIIYAPLADICFEQGNFDEAEALATRGIDLGRRLFSNIVLGGDSEITLARIAFERGSPKQAFDILESTKEAARQRGVLSVVNKMALVQTELDLLWGHQAEAALRLQELTGPTGSDLAKLRGLVAHLEARYRVAAGDSAGALQILTRLEEDDKAEGALRRLMGVYLTQTLAYQQGGDRSQARDVFEQALRMAAPEGYRAIFRPHPGRPIRSLLQASRGVAPAFVDSILDHSPAPTHEPEEPITQTLVDPLTDQQLRVLALIVAGKTNQEIAAELVITLGTAKWHVHNVLQKLGVTRRAQAVIRARELGLG